MKIKDIRPNPFKKFINDGKLNEEQVERLKESIEHGTLPKRFTVRKTSDGCELIFGHHRLEAYRQTKGGDFDVDVDVMDYTDEQMLIDMVRENLLQRNTEFHDEEDAVVLAREWLRSGTNSVSYFYRIKTDKNPKGAGAPKIDGSSRDVASFLSKQGKAISHMKVSEGRKA